MMLKKSGSWIARALFVALLLLSTQRLFASVLFESGKGLYELERYWQAIGLFQKSYLLNSENPELIRYLGSATYHQSLLQPDPRWIKKSESYFERLCQILPFDGRARSYLARLKLKMALQSTAGLTMDVWQGIKTLYDRAVADEPGSAWVSFQRGQGYLRAFHFLDEEGRQTAVLSLTKAVSLHYPRQSSPYLKPSLDLVWRRFKNFEVLKQLLPADELSYLTALNFLAERSLWQYRAELYPDFDRLTRRAYDEDFQKALELFERGDLRRAETAFEKNYWINKNFVRAPLGLMAVRCRLEPNREIDQVQLRRCLQDEKENYAMFLPWIKSAVDKTEDPYLMGLYAIRTNDFRKAKDFLEKVQPSAEHKDLRRYRVKACVMTGDDERRDRYRQEILAEAAPDLRDLYAFVGKDSIVDPQMSHKINQIATHEKKAEDWWSPQRTKGNRLVKKGDRSGVVLNLKAGQAKITLSARSIPNERGMYAYVRLRLYDGAEMDNLTEIYLAAASWNENIWIVETNGGNRWLEAELINGGAGRPLAELGTVKVEYVHDNS
jgi:tetratricopeptide (TPR) repeat protein